MERHVERFLNRLSILIAAIATLSLLHLSSHRSLLHCTSSPHTHIHSHTHSQFPSSTCDPTLPSRDLLPPDKRFKKLSSTSAFTSRASSLSSLFLSLRSLRLLSNSSRVLCLSSAPAHDAFALSSSGVSDVTAVDLLEFPPLVDRADPHNLPFFDSVFDLAFTAGGLDTSLFPSRFASEMERTVREGGAEAVLVYRLGSLADEIGHLFPRSSLIEVRNLTLSGDEMTLFLMRRNANLPPPYSPLSP